MTIPTATASITTTPEGGEALGVGDNFFAGRVEYQVTRIEEVGEELANMRSRLIEHGKEPRIYYAGKVLKSGKPSSAQGGMFYRFTSGKMLKVL